MQFHLNGFRAGDPHIEPASDESARATDEVDVLIVGCGPAGLTLAAQLAAFPDITTRIVERKPGPLSLGQADGVACRTMEMFEAFGFSERVLKEGYWVNETAFWRPDETRPENIVRGGRVQDTEDGLSEFPHMILNQARVHDFYLDVMQHSPSRLTPDYGCTVSGLQVNRDHPHPVAVQLSRAAEDGGEAVEMVRARYVVGCDGARSAVRNAVGLELRGESANKAWGVMDVLAVTNFPDIRFKCVIRSANEGNIIIIPREGGYLVRLYIELEQLRDDERVSARNIGTDDLIAAARRILSPHTLEVKEIAWWSVYEIGQRLCDRFDDADPTDASMTPRVFIAGDACHTHSPKAGQGMNVSMGDAFNLGWKLGAVLRGQASAALLHTYSAERQAVAEELIAFDRHWAKRFNERPKAEAGTPGEALDPAEFQDYFTKHGRFTAGTAFHYAASSIVAETRYQALAPGFVVGMRFHSAPVVRAADAKPLELGTTVKADGRWRLFLFADRSGPSGPSARVVALCRFLAEDPASPVVAYTQAGAELDALVDVRAVFQEHHHALDLQTLPALLRPAKGPLGLADAEKVFCPDLKNSADIFAMRGVDREQGCLVLVRPDQHVAHVLPLDATRALSAFFNKFMLPSEARSDT